MDSYYSEKLAAEKLRQCYRLATPRIVRYLQAEIDHVLKRIDTRDRVLELGCGYGRVLKRLCGRLGVTCGIDTSLSSLKMAKSSLNDGDNCYLVCANAVQTAFQDNVFDCVICIQNGISVFNVDHRKLFIESLRITKPGGRVLFSTYSEKFWQERLEWFVIQSNAGLLGEIDFEKTGNGTIVCKDGFQAVSITEDMFREWTKGLGATVTLEEVDNSSKFCEMVKIGS